tara:strand:- start:635 stop:826 length:192 start_codon:yes stop_codon:yes gene_type:complete
MKKGKSKTFLFLLVMTSLFGFSMLFGWLVGAKSNPNPRNEYYSVIDSFENDFVNTEIDKLNDK